jgi:uncharacterized membrane protein YeaQ/YmgE (transglycosylase-associated protein family)
MPEGWSAELLSSAMGVFSTLISKFYGVIGAVVGALLFGFIVTLILRRSS